MENKKIILPKNHVAEWNGETFNWFSGDAVTYPKYIPDVFWCFAIPQPHWNTRRAKYCGKLNHKTRELYDINKLDEK